MASRQQAGAHEDDDAMQDLAPASFGVPDGPRAVMRQRAAGGVRVVPGYLAYIECVPVLLKKAINSRSTSSGESWLGAKMRVTRPYSCVEGTPK